jgi:RNA polymerase sigma-70 factor (ECF subfamily)
MMPPTESARLDPERWVAEHGDALFHYALSRVRDPGAAEDLVQDALLSALKGHERYEGRSTERTWLVGILKNKVLDHFRAARREACFTDIEFFADAEEGSFESGVLLRHWLPASAPGEWEGAGAELDRVEFWGVFQRCTGRLPERIACAFVLREVDGLSTNEICTTLDISASNLWVMLHRARLALRLCLETHWFQTHRPSADHTKDPTPV